MLDLNGRTTVDIDGATGVSIDTQGIGDGKSGLVTTANALLTSITTEPDDAVNNANLTGRATTTNGSGSGAVLTLVIVGNKVTGITVTTFGTGYKALDILTVAGGSGTIQTIAIANATGTNSGVINDILAVLRALGLIAS